MKANITKRLACTLLALAVMITTVFVHVESAQAAERYTYAYKSTDNETAYAGTEVKTPFTLTNNQGIGILIVATAPVDMKITVYNSNGVAMDWADNPFYASASTDWHYDSGVGEYVFTAVLKACLLYTSPSPRD